MKKILRSALGMTLFGAALVAIGITACDSEPPQKASVSETVNPEVTAADETSADVVRNSLVDILRDQDAYSRARRLGVLLPTLGPEFIPTVKQTLEDTSLDLGATELELLVRFWATHQGEDASRWSVEKSPPGYRLAAVMTALSLWAGADPQAAANATQQWAAQNPDVGDAVQVALVRGWFTADPAKLAQYIHNIDMGFTRQRALATYIRAMIQAQGIEAAVRWAESVPDDDATYKMAVYRQMAAALPLFDHDAVLRWCEAHCEGPHGNNMRSIIARRWVRSDGAAALVWLSEAAPEGHDKNLAVRAAFALWGQIDREATLAWMQTQTAGESGAWLQPVFPVYARLLSADSPADAIEWAERIEGDEEREIVLTEVARAWRLRDEAAAEAWLLQSSLSEEAREKARAPGR
ncbi:MAG: hypothetical protein JRE38_06410 [Deltaproteobacteria bacterium]|nr:hypothetical protein [Deltaproteobacteria bacterium]MBW2692639.1 hypothetical protein [Deltaproteobacteria bacterium]